jgi:hypothetical protein
MKPGRDACGVPGISCAFKSSPTTRRMICRLRVRLDGCTTTRSGGISLTRRDEALPHLLTVVMEYFDVALDNEPDLIARGVSTPYRPPDAA